ncbi:glycosyltransferase [Rhodobacterales bacterium FZCC0069]|nr:glycosyltransferase [Rhodobacterales bacterium FZCC0069]
MHVKYSIVIPTRNRVDYLPYAVHSVLGSDRDDVELIVSNNHSNDGTDKFLSELNDPRLRVIQPSVVLPMAGHYEFAINEARGDWITLLGDDDAVMPYIFERLDYYASQFPEVDIISSERAYYFWEGCKDLYGNIVVGYRSRQDAALRSTKRDLMSVLKGARSCFDMPQIYTTGIIKSSLYNEIKIKSGGCFYHSIIPDMYSAVALCLSRDTYLRVEEPLFWVGTSDKSMGISDRIYKDAELFNEDCRADHPCVPRKISDNTSYTIHANAFSSAYIYECLMSSPLKQKEHLTTKLRKRVLAAVLMESRSAKRSDKERKEVFNAIRKECRDYGVSMTSIITISIINIFTSRFRRLVRTSVRILKKFALSEATIYFQSSSRAEFPTILHASKMVLQKRSSK